MVVSHYRSRMSESGSIYKSYRGRRRSELGSVPVLTKVDARKTKTQRTRGGNSKTRLLSENSANVYNPKTKKYEQLEMEGVVESPADINYVRRNIMVKGTVVKTSKGNARITNRPGQEGTINAVLIE
ncbi:MAG: 30S ribosomal protein S8e [Nanoarchaeota archaeon]